MNWQISKGDYGISMVFETEDGMPFYIASNIARERDAKLIAASPDVAEALSQVMQMIGGECDCIHSDESNPVQCPCKLARAALAKAGL